MTFYDLLLRIAYHHLENQERGSVPAGHNGPYHDKETPVRASAHWLVTFGWAYRQTGDERFLARVNAIIDYLASPQARPGHATFHCRDTEGKDRCNGLIGQAWVFEALGEAASLLKDDAPSNLAEEVFFLHPFDQTRGTWSIRDVDGWIRGVDLTFNHQLWFAACAAGLKGSNRQNILDCVSVFLNQVPVNLEVSNDGLIHHLVAHKRPSRPLKVVLHRILPGHRSRSTGGFPNRAIGYHAFNMYGFALLRNLLPEHPFWRSPVYARITEYLMSDHWKMAIDDNPYSYPYNPPGFEVPYALLAAEYVDEQSWLSQAEWWVKEQLRRTYNSRTLMFDRGNPDPITLTARIYEATRLPNALLHGILVDEVNLAFARSHHSEKHTGLDTLEAQGQRIPEPQTFKAIDVETKHLPFVSVIIPAYNAERTIDALLASLQHQTYPQCRYEVLLVDNNSTDATEILAGRYPVTLLEEREIQSSYAARNTGLRKARGEIIAFVDADCVADENWIESGVCTLQDSNADLVAGAVKFTYTKNPSGAEVFDSLTNMQQERSVQLGYAKTANLYTRAEAFQKIGLFPNTAISGGDVQWTEKATSSGLKLVYAPDAVVKHPARGLLPLLAKQYRVGQGVVEVRRSRGISDWRTAKYAVGACIPSSPSSFRQRMRLRNPDMDVLPKGTRMWGVAYLCRLARSMGILRELVRTSLRKR